MRSPFHLDRTHTNFRAPWTLNRSVGRLGSNLRTSKKARICSGNTSLVRNSGWIMKSLSRFKRQHSPSVPLELNRKENAITSTKTLDQALGFMKSGWMEISVANKITRKKIFLEIFHLKFDSPNSNSFKSHFLLQCSWIKTCPRHWAHEGESLIENVYSVLGFSTQTLDLAYAVNLKLR